MHKHLRVGIESYNSTIPLDLDNIQKDQPYDIGGLTIVVEKLAGDTRTGVDASGKAWKCVIPAHYGYFLNTVGGDGDALDFYLNPTAISLSETVYIIDQQKLEDSTWNEHKVMLGFDSETAAKNTYISAFSDKKGEARLTAIVTMTIYDFICWVLGGDTKSSIAKQEIPWTHVSIFPLLKTKLRDSKIYNKWLFL